MTNIFVPVQLRMQLYVAIYLLSREESFWDRQDPHAASTTLTAIRVRSMMYVKACNLGLEW